MITHTTRAPFPVKSTRRRPTKCASGVPLTVCCTAASGLLRNSASAQHMAGRGIRVPTALGCARQLADTGHPSQPRIAATVPWTKARSPPTVLCECCVRWVHPAAHSRGLDDQVCGWKYVRLYAPSETRRCALAGTRGLSLASRGRPGLAVPSAPTLPPSATAPPPSAPALYCATQAVRTHRGGRAARAEEH